MQGNDIRTVVFAFPYGRPSNLRSNHRIARRAEWRANEVGAPLYADWGLDLFDQGIETWRPSQQPMDPMPTLRAARAFIRKAKEGRFHKAIIVAAEPHMPRVLRDLEIAKKEIRSSIVLVPDDELFKERDYTWLSWFDEDSTEARTRGPLLWIAREATLHGLYAFAEPVYKLVSDPPQFRTRRRA